MITITLILLIMPILEQLGMQAASNVLGEGMGIAFQGIKNRQQLKQAGRLQELQIKGQKEMTNYNTAKQLEMWKNTSYPAQKEMLEKAGLNAGLLYGMGGGGGQTANIASGNVSGQSAEVARGMGLQNMLTKAQVDNLNADTQDKLANLPGKGKEAGLKDAQTKNLKVDTQVKEQEVEIKKIAASVSRQTINEQMRAWEQIIEKNDAEIHKLWLDNDLTEAQMQDKKDLLKQQVAAEAAKTALMNSEINRNGVLNKLTDAQWQDLIQKMWLDREYLSEEKLLNVYKRWAIQNDIETDDGGTDVVVPIIGSVKDLLKPKQQPYKKK